MSSGTFIILNGFKKIGVHSIVSPASPNSINDGVFHLNSMLERWQSLRIIIGTTPLQVAGDELNEPIDATIPIIDNFALSIAPNFDNGKTIVSSRLDANARSGFSAMKRLYQRHQIPDRQFSSTLPSGEGNTFNRFGVFFHTDADIKT